MNGRHHLLSLTLALVLPGPAVDAAEPDAGVDRDEITIPEDQTTTLRIEPRVGHPIERDPEFSSKIPSYQRALAMDRDQRWSEAAGLYQQALAEIGRAFRLASTPLVERAATKIEVERRRSQTLAVATSTASRSLGPAVQAPAPRVSALERGRLLRLKLMAVRAGTGVVPADLVLATLRSLEQAERTFEARALTEKRPPGQAHDPHRLGGDPEIRLLQCAARATAGDRGAARIVLAHVAHADRTDPARALGMAICAAALGRDDEAMASLAVVLDKLGASSRAGLLPLGQTTELYSDNDWDSLRGNPRFERLFH